jgi:hypothetical protein
VWLLRRLAPAPTALEAAAHVDRKRRRVLGRKLRGWPDVLVAAGVTMAHSGNLVTDERHELDQGQHDSTTDLLAVDSAGMLVQRRVGRSAVRPALPLFRDDLDFCWRARAPATGDRRDVGVVHHRGPRPTASSGRRRLA